MDSGNETVVVGLYRKTRKRIKTNASKQEMSMKDYVEKLVPSEKGE